MNRLVDWVVFDIGGTLVDETPMWRHWARRMGVDETQMLAELDAVLAGGRHHREVFAALAPGFDLSALDEEPYRIAPQDFFPDALPALRALDAAGFRLAVAANQPQASEAILLESGLPLAFALSSARAGVAKPDPVFFARVVEACGIQPGRIAYVGDRLDNDVLPANAAGLVSVFVPRGPWGRLHAMLAEAGQATVTVDDLNALPQVLAVPSLPNGR